MLNGNNLIINKQLLIMLLSIIILIALNNIAFASETDMILVKAIEINRGSVSLGKKSFYTKTYDVSLSNLNKDVDLELKKLCIIAHDKQGKEFSVDTIDENLTKGKLSPSPEKYVKGVVVFSSSTEDVYNANMVKIKNCQTDNSLQPSSLNSGK